MKFKKIAAALAAAVMVTGSSAVSLSASAMGNADMGSVDHTFDNTGITLKSGGKILPKERDDYYNSLHREEYFIGMWEPQTLEITVTEEAFKDREEVELRISFAADVKSGLDVVFETSWDCRSTVYWGTTPFAVTMYRADGTREYTFDALGGGLHYAEPLKILDGTIAEVNNIFELESSSVDNYLYHLGSTDGTDYTGAGKGVYSYSLNKEEPYSYYEGDTLVESRWHVYNGIIFSEPGTVTITMKDRNAVDEQPDDQKPDADGKTALNNKNESVSVNGVFPEGTTLNASVKKNDNGSYTYDITPVDKDGNKVQPEGAAVVMVPLPEEFKGKTVFVYRIEDGRYIGLQSWVDGDWLFFTTSHFSEFEMTTEQRAGDNPDTGSAAGIGFAVVALAGALMIVSKKKR